MPRKPRNGAESVFSELESIQSIVASAQLRLKEMAKTPDGASNIVQALGGEPLQRNEVLPTEVSSVVKIMLKSPELSNEILRYAIFISRKEKVAPSDSEKSRKNKAGIDSKG